MQLINRVLTNLIAAKLAIGKNQVLIDKKDLTNIHNVT